MIKRPSWKLVCKSNFHHGMDEFIKLPVIELTDISYQCFKRCGVSSTSSLLIIGLSLSLLSI